MALRSSVHQFELVEDPLSVSVARLRLPLRAQPCVDLVEAVVGLEDTTHEELGRDGAVPVVLLKAEGDVIASLAPIAFEPGPLSKRDRAAGVASVTVDAEAKVLSVTDRGEIPELATRREQRDVRIGQPERRQGTQLLTEFERQLRTARQDGVDDRRREEVFRPQQTFRLRRERLGE